jgi:hypothetical protein
MSNTTDKAMSLRQSAVEKIRAVQADKDLTVGAKARRIAEIREAANKKISELKSAHVKEQFEQSDKLHHRLFGLSFKITATESDKTLERMSYRDALFRADSIEKPQDALRLLGRARMVDDKLLSKAIAAIAYERDWAGVLDDYAGTSEAVAEDFQALNIYEMGRINAQNRVSDSMSFSQIPESKEEQTARMSGELSQTAEAK